MCGTQTLGGLICQLVGLINLIIPLLGGAALILFLWGCLRYITQVSEGNAHGHSDALDAIRWGGVALFVFVSIWGILHVAQLAVFGQ